jgi:hypothetical protein
MEQIVIQVKNKEKAKILHELLASLDFVEFVRMATKDNDTEETEDFFALAGLWEGRDISQESIRQQAWPRQSS